MDWKRIGQAAFCVCVALCLLQIAYFWSRLPDRVAIHFGPSGAPNGWSSKEVFLGLYLGVVVLLSALFWRLSGALLREPDSRLRLPNKDYWLAPEHRAEASDAFAGFSFSFGAATLLLLFDMFGQAIEVNLGRASRLDHPVASLIGYVLIAAGLNIALVRKFKSPERRYSTK